MKGLLKISLTFTVILLALSVPLQVKAEERPILEVNVSLSENFTEDLEVDQLDFGPPEVEYDPSLAVDLSELDGFEDGDIYENPDDIASPFVIIGEDNRYPIVNPTSYPYSSVTHLIMHWEYAGSTTCTGTLIDSNSILTAGHCLVDTGDRPGGEQGRLLAVQIIPGRNGPVASFGAGWATSVYIPKEYNDTRTPDYDYGVINTNSDFSRAGSMGLASLNDSSLLNTNFTINGYPGDKARQQGNYYQWAHSGRLTAVLPLTVRYQIDTTGGQSGAPLYYHSGAYRIAGVHSSGVSNSSGAGLYNISKRITSSSENYIRYVASLD